MTTDKTVKTTSATNPTEPRQALPQEPTKQEQRAGKVAEWMIGGILILVCITIFAQAWSLGLGTLVQPGDGLWPFIVSVVILAAIPFAVRDTSIAEPFRVTMMWRAALMAVALILFVVLYYPIGFIGATFVTVLITVRCVCSEGWLSTMLISIITPIAAYLIFGVLFQVAINPLPGVLTF